MPEFTRNVQKIYRLWYNSPKENIAESAVAPWKSEAISGKKLFLLWRIWSAQIILRFDFLVLL